MEKSINAVVKNFLVNFYTIQAFIDFLPVNFNFSILNSSGDARPGPTSKGLCPTINFACLIITRSVRLTDVILKSINECTKKAVVYTPLYVASPAVITIPLHFHSVSVTKVLYLAIEHFHMVIKY